MLVIFIIVSLSISILHFQGFKQKRYAFLKFLIYLSSTHDVYTSKQSCFLLKLLLLSQAKIVLFLNRNCACALNSFRNKLVTNKWRQVFRRLMF